MILIIDNYDSFTYNLKHYIAEICDLPIKLFRNDEITISEIEEMGVSHIVISPGPCDPDKAGISLELVKHFAGKIPIFGVCLGHQTIGQAFGGKIVRASQPMHGKISVVQNTGQGVFAGLPQEFEVTRYHSLIIEVDSLPDCLQITSSINENGEDVIMAVQHKEHNIHGVQFHPESIASQYGKDILRNFIQG